MQGKRIRGLKHQLRNQTAKRRKTIYIAVGTLVCVITTLQLTQAATKVFWQIVLEVISELIALFIASKIEEMKVK
jgi:NAD/NADP transhydrogenase beta subunit